MKNLNLLHTADCTSVVARQFPVANLSNKIDYPLSDATPAKSVELLLATTKSNFLNLDMQFSGACLGFQQEWAGLTSRIR